MQDTRRQILEILKHCGEVTVQDLAKQLDLTSVTVRHHLEILRDEGYVTDPEVRRLSRPGRPCYVYRLTSTATSLFPNNYQGLACALLHALRDHAPTPIYDKVLLETARNLASDKGCLPRDPTQRLEKVIDYLNAHGFVACSKKDPLGNDYIHVHNCPYHYVAKDEPCACEIDEHLISLLTGAALERVRGYASREGICSYKITWPQTKQEDERA